MSGSSSRAHPQREPEQPRALKELRAAALFLRREAPGALWRFLRRAAAGTVDPDERILDILADPFASVDDTYERLSAAESRLRNRSDRRSVFLTVYAAMTDRVRSGIRSGNFNDVEWVRRYLVAFADRYREALRAFERGEDREVPPPWRVAFGAALADRTLLIQDALLGINAHINYDLSYSLNDVGIDPNRSAKLEDHNRINDVLQGLIDVVQRTLAEVYRARGYSRVDSLLGSFDEDFAMIGLTESRALAWRNATILTDTPSRLVRRAVRFRIRTVSTGAGYCILSPSANPTLLEILRKIEADDLPLAEFRESFERRLQTSPIPPV